MTINTRTLLSSFFSCSAILIIAATHVAAQKLPEKKTESPKEFQSRMLSRDENRDERLSAKELGKSAKVVLHRGDLNLDGFLDKNELARLAESRNKFKFGKEPSEAKNSRSLFDIIDLNRDGDISINEYESGIKRLAEFDRNRDGRISKAELGDAVVSSKTFVAGNLSAGGPITSPPLRIPRLTPGSMITNPKILGLLGSYRHPRTAPTFTYSKQNGELTVTGSGGSDFVNVSQGSGQLGGVNVSFVTVDDPGTPGIDVLEPNIRSVVVRLGKGNDFFQVVNKSTFSIDLTVFGGEGDDRIWGSDHEDQLHGGHGVDSISGFGGDDKIFGSFPHKTIPWPHAIPNRDPYLATEGDFIHGGDGDDYIEGGESYDTIYGGNGNDRIHGINQGDRLVGGPGTNEIQP